MVYRGELIVNTISDVLNEVTNKMMSLDRGLTVHLNLLHNGQQVD